MPETTAPATELASQYITQVTGDLETNLKEQERISAEIASLQEQLAALQHDHSVLVNMQQALGITTAPTKPAAESKTAAVPSPRRKKAAASAGGKQKEGKSTASPGRRAARKSAAKTAGAVKAAQPTLVELIRRHLAEQQEPRSAAEISTALGQAHPARDIAPKVVRVTLEGLVAKSQAKRSKQGRSVFYAAPGSEPTVASGTEAQPEDADC
jgi:cell division septum initiation protein DivIVA